VVIINNHPIPDDKLIGYAESRRYPVSVVAENIQALGLNVVLANVLDEQNPSCHDVDKLAVVLRELV